MGNDDLTCVNVAEDALVEFIERVVVSGGFEIRASKGDRGWYVTYRPPFTRDVKERDPSCSPQMIAEADCKGDRAKCGDVCHRKNEYPHITIEGTAHV